MSLQWHDLHQLGARLDELTYAQCARPHGAIDRGANGGVTQVQLRLILVRNRPETLGLSQLSLGLEDLDLLTGASQCGLRTRNTRGFPLEVRGRLIRLLIRAEAHLRHLTTAAIVTLSQCGCGLCNLQIRLGLTNGVVLCGQLRGEVGDHRGGCAQDWHSPRAARSADRGHRCAPALAPP